MDYDSARAMMIKHQLRPWGVTDERVLSAILRVHREDTAVPFLRRALLTKPKF